MLVYDSCVGRGGGPLLGRRDSVEARRMHSSLVDLYLLQRCPTQPTCMSGFLFSRGCRAAGTLLCCFGQKVRFCDFFPL